MCSRNLKTQNPLNKPKSPLPTTQTPGHKKHTSVTEKRQASGVPKLGAVSDEKRGVASDTPAVTASVPVERTRSKNENAKESKIAALLIKYQNSSQFFLGIEIDDCEDVEIYVETIGLMYCKELKQRLIKQSVSRVLRLSRKQFLTQNCILGMEQLGFKSCMLSCLEYLEAVPWVGEEEEEKVVSSVLRLQSEGIE
ncbi:hypothetical protein HAX54_046941 [Datura stramonium]|uniref:Uncharacterized protein n=1 Tax=Datura stramonium TaxID=4076 RepID=A0ABS8RPV7_DATST|nr:hypothetical protein [Datura stramonium]